MADIQVFIPDARISVCPGPSRGGSSSLNSSLLAIALMRIGAMCSTTSRARPRPTQSCSVSNRLPVPAIALKVVKVKDVLNDPRSGIVL